MSLLQNYQILVSPVLYCLHTTSSEFPDHDIINCNHRQQQPLINVNNDRHIDGYENPLLVAGVAEKRC